MRKVGRVVAIASTAGLKGYAYVSAYSAAKHALHGYFESLRLETEKSGVRILLVCPGKVKTSISINAADADGSKHNAMDPSHENAMSPAECALQIINAIKKGKEEIYVGGKELMIIPIKRFFPALFRKIIRRQNPL